MGNVKITIYATEKEAEKWRKKAEEEGISLSLYLKLKIEDRLKEKE